MCWTLRPWKSGRLETFAASLFPLSLPRIALTLAHAGFVTSLWGVSLKARKEPRLKPELQHLSLTASQKFPELPLESLSPCIPLAFGHSFEVPVQSQDVAACAAAASCLNAVGDAKVFRAHVPSIVTLSGSRQRPSGSRGQSRGPLHGAQACQAFFFVEGRATRNPQISFFPLSHLGLFGLARAKQCLPNRSHGTNTWPAAVQLSIWLFWASFWEVHACPFAGASNAAFSFHMNQASCHVPVLRLGLPVLIPGVYKIEAEVGGYQDSFPCRWNEGRSMAHILQKCPVDEFILYRSWTRSRGPPPRSSCTCAATVGARAKTAHCVRLVC